MQMLQLLQGHSRLGFSRANASPVKTNPASTKLCSGYGSVRGEAQVSPSTSSPSLGSIRKWPGPLETHGFHRLNPSARFTHGGGSPSHFGATTKSSARTLGCSIRALRIGTLLGRLWIASAGDTLGYASTGLRTRIERGALKPANSSSGIRWQRTSLLVSNLPERRT